MLAIMGCAASKMTTAVAESGHGSVSNSIRSEIEATAPLRPVSIPVPESIESGNQAKEGVSELSAMSAFPCMARSEKPASEFFIDISPDSRNHSSLNSNHPCALDPTSEFCADELEFKAAEEHTDNYDDTKNEISTSPSYHPRPQDKSSIFLEKPRSMTTKNAKGNVNTIAVAVLDPNIGGKEQSSKSVVPSSIYSLSITSRKAAMVASREATTPIHSNNDSSLLVASSSAVVEPVDSATEDGTSPNLDVSSHREDGGDTTIAPESSKCRCRALAAIALVFFALTQRSCRKFKTMAESINFDIPFTCAIVTFVIHSSIIFSGK